MTAMGMAYGDLRALRLRTKLSLESRRAEREGNN